MEAGNLFKAKKSKFTKGCTRGQLALVRAAGPHKRDYLTPFLVVMAVWYCHVARPAVEDGTDAAHAVLAVMLEPSMRKAMLSTVVYNRLLQYTPYICHAIRHQDMSSIPVINVTLTRPTTICHRHMSSVCVISMCHQHISSIPSSPYVICVCHQCHPLALNKLMSSVYVISIGHQYMCPPIHAMHACSQMKSRFQRWGNNKAMLACIDPLHQWVRKGNKDTRLECVRNLTLEPFVLDVAPENEPLTATELIAECHTLVVEFFLAFASGKVNDGEINTRTKKPLTGRQKPYGSKVGQTSAAFKSVSPSWLAITGASLYPFLVAEKEEWEDVKEKTIAYPVTSFWPGFILRRFVHYNQTFWEKLPSVFKSYEAAGGKYYPDSDEAEEDVGDGELMEGDAGCDNVF